MIVAMQDQATEKQVQDVIERMVELGFNVHRTTGANQTILAGVGNAGALRCGGVFKVLLRRARRLPHLLALQAGGAQLPAGGTKVAFPTEWWWAARRSSSWRGPARSSRASRSC